MDAPLDASRYSTEVVLLDGTPARIRAIRPDDKRHFRAGMAQLSQQSARLRFFTAKKRLSDKELRYFTELDFVDHVGLVALLEEDGAEVAIGVGRYIVDGASGGRRAEVAFTVLDHHQGRGVATLLLHHLADLARPAGIREFTAVVLAENRNMLEVFENSGYPERHTYEDGEVRVTMDISAGVREA